MAGASGGQKLTERDVGRVVGHNLLATGVEVFQKYGLSRCCKQEADVPRVVGDELLQEMVRCILMVVRPDRIIVFGSAASGQLSDGNDLDIYEAA